MTVESAPGAGTEIELRVPVEGVHDAGDGGRRPPDVARRRWPATSPRRATRWWRPRATAREAVRRAPAARPEVVVLDLQLPVLSGVEVTRALVAADPSVRVLVLSASAASTRTCWRR